jgi:hypothetical protein
LIWGRQGRALASLVHDERYLLFEKSSASPSEFIVNIVEWHVSYLFHVRPANPVVIVLFFPTCVVLVISLIPLLLPIIDPVNIAVMHLNSPVSRPLVPGQFFGEGDAAVFSAFTETADDELNCTPIVRDFGVVFLLLFGDWRSGISVILRAYLPVCNKPPILETRHPKYIFNIQSRLVGSLTFPIPSQHRHHLLFNVLVRSLKQAREILRVQHVLSQTLGAAVVGVSDVLGRIAHFPQVEFQVWETGEGAAVGVGD